ncbi:hypothetical protein [Yoonia sp. R2-816]|uniref:hypothetical protein n=1 Tax=Yoonia sp. R2-816 TaxID=3342638 RepID=UPI00372D36E4
MTSLVRRTRSHPERASKWLASLLERKSAPVATVAMANKTARIVWAVLTRNEPYSLRAAACGQQALVERGDVDIFYSDHPA